jgi:adenylate cyclase
LSHWMMAIVSQLHEGDFERSVVEAEAAAKLVPYDAFARADLAGVLVNAGKIDRAIEWSEESIRRDASPMDFYYAWLAIAYYFDDRPADSIATFQKMSAPWDVNMAAAYVRLGKFEEARASIARLLKSKPGWTIQKKAVWPTTKQPQYVEPLLKTYLADLAKAGLPEK